MSINIYVCIASIILQYASFQAQERRLEKDRDLLMMFWNLENFFDCTDSGAGESDKEFSPEGTRRWTWKKFYAKCHAISKSIYYISDIYGKLPDIIGLAEIENKDVLTRLIYSTALNKAGYSIVHYDSPDHRGIDVALLWRKENMSLMESRPYVIENMQTRDILHVKLRAKDSKSDTDCIVVHLPSKFGGGKTAWKRDTVATRLKAITDSLILDNSRRVVIMGDFNDSPDSEEFNILRENLENKADSLHIEKEGTLRYNGKWEIIDMFWVTHNLNPNTSMSILRLPFLMVRDNMMAGEKPLRTYSGPKYLGGVSDHCPIILTIRADSQPEVQDK